MKKKLLRPGDMLVYRGPGWCGDGEWGIVVSASARECLYVFHNEFHGMYEYATGRDTNDVEYWTEGGWLVLR